jgi:hypothetical protein
MSALQRAPVQAPACTASMQAGVRLFVGGYGTSAGGRRFLLAGVISRQ